MTIVEVEIAELRYVADSICLRCIFVWTLILPMGRQFTRVSLLELAARRSIFSSHGIVAFLSILGICEQADQRMGPQHLYPGSPYHPQTTGRSSPTAV